jgi:hypothetical protein
MCKHFGAKLNKAGNLDLACLGKKRIERDRFNLMKGQLKIILGCFQGNFKKYEQLPTRKLKICPCSFGLLMGTFCGTFVEGVQG